MIISQHFDEALKTISVRKLQLENGLIHYAPKGIKTDIKKIISKQVFSIFQMYYSNDVMKNFKRENLIAMDLETLKNTDFNKLNSYRSFELTAEKRLMNTINTFSNSNLSI